MLLAVALALLLAQGFSAVLLYRAQAERREGALIHAAAFRLLVASRGGPPEHDGEHAPPPDMIGMPRSLHVVESLAPPLMAGELRDGDDEAELRRILQEQEVRFAEVVVVHRDIAGDPEALRKVERHRRLLGQHRGPEGDRMLVAGLRRPDDGHWLVVRVLIPGDQRTLLATLLGQTLLIYGVLVGAIAFILRRITEPLRLLTDRVERFADTRDAAGQIEPEGPDDMRRLIVAHNRMEGRVAALLDEKNVMLGAIGHDLKTPLAALRVRIESVEDDAERGKMAATIEDIVRSLDDILSLARVGRPSDPRESTELSALVGAVVEEYEDMGEAVTLEESQRIVMPLRATWLRRALRNLIGNALRYGKAARVRLAREDGMAVVRIDDDGPGIAEGDIARMLEPFTRGDPSRNSETGGAGLGLTLARAIADQHGGTLSLANRRGSDGAVLGLTATLRLPLA
ncbi:MAG: two-component sensor histidine kinase [Sphingomonadales bacterium]|nr:two-component sensor histidine kinase [Sphingomonadales bacterium]